MEVLGPGSLFSFNFDSRFAKKENGIGFRLGLGGSPLGLLGESCNSGVQISLPAGVNYLIGQRCHFLELGGGGVLVMISATKRYCIQQFKKIFFDDRTESYGYLLAGYRLQPESKKGFTYRIFISPLFQNNFPLKFWGGVSIGKKF